MWEQYVCSNTGSTGFWRVPAMKKGESKVKGENKDNAYLRLSQHLQTYWQLYWTSFFVTRGRHGGARQWKGEQARWWGKKEKGPDHQFGTPDATERRTDTVAHILFSGTHRERHNQQCHLQKPDKWWLNESTKTEYVSTFTMWYSR